ncbi:MAG TPA: ABC transporter permease [Kribbella sp.]
MTATLAAPENPVARRVPITRGYRFELVKLLSQWRIRVLIVACWVAPAVFVAVVSQQASLPVDTLFGRMMHATGWAGPLVLLGFSGSWALPLLTSLVAGDVFASEDRLGTWRHLLVAVRSPRRIFISKALSSLTVIVVLVIGLVDSSAISGLLVVGNRQLIGLDGHLLSPGDAAGTVLLAWLCALAPTLALAAIGLLGSVAMGRSPMGLLLPAVVALAMQIVQQLPVPVAVRLALPGYAFISWNGLFTAPAQVGPLLIGVIVSLVWAVVATGLAYFLFVRRDFTNPTHDGSGRLALTAGLVPLVVLLGLSTVAIAPVSGFGSGIDQDKVQRAVAVEFAHLYRLQTKQLNRADVTEEQLQSTAECTKGGDQVAARGPGNDWRCVITWHLPGVDAAGSAIYQLDINPLGRYVSDGDGPKEVNGFFLVRTPSGDEPNPLWQFDGNIELLPAN